MKNLQKLGVIVAALASFGMANAELGVGNPAPALKVAKWAKGKPVAKFEPGKVYVVEFWATWCGPCKQSIPHLTELAKKFKDKVTFTGVSVWENQDNSKSNAYVAKVEKFVKDMGAKMDYNVAIDDVNGTMARTWMQAANQDGIPAAFIIDQKGTIAWIGHPMADLEKVLDQVVAGTYDTKAAATREAELTKSREDLNKTMAEVMQLFQSDKKAEAVTKLDEVMAKHPEVKNELSGFKFQLILSYDEPGAYKYAKAAGENEWKDNSMMLNQIAWTIIEAKDPVKKPDFDVAVTLAQRAAELTKFEDPMILDTLAFGLYKKGDKAKAIELQTKAVALLESKKDIDEATKKEIKDRLEMFKKGG